MRVNDDGLNSNYKIILGKQGYIMATQIGQIMHAMEQDFDEKSLRKLIRKFDADGSGKLEFDEFW